jgi:uncharacterized membrane protein YwaF
MSHFPVNHPLRPLYRFLIFLAGVYVTLFGAVGLVRTGRGDLFGRADVWVLGLRTNLAFSLASVVVGLALLVAVLIGLNVDAVAAVLGGVVFMVAGGAMMAVLRSDLNVLNFSIATVIVSFLIGTLLFTAGMYIRWAPRRRPTTRTTTEAAPAS